MILHRPPRWALPESRRKRFLLAVPLIAAGCATAPPQEGYEAAGPTFSAQIFFSGRTEGDGQVRIVLAASHPIRVHGTGHIEADGTLVLDQTVEAAGKPAKQRQWRIRQVAPGRYAGMLTDATGPVAGDVSGNRLHLAFRMKGRLDVQQWLTLAPDARSARNHMIVRKFGVVVAVLDETIRKLR